MIKVNVCSINIAGCQCAIGKAEGVQRKVSVPKSNAISVDFTDVHDAFLFFFYLIGIRDFLQWT